MPKWQRVTRLVVEKVSEMFGKCHDNDPQFATVSEMEDRRGKPSPNIPLVWSVRETLESATTPAHQPPKKIVKNNYTEARPKHTKHLIGKSHVCQLDRFCSNKPWRNCDAKKNTTHQHSEPSSQVTAKVPCSTYMCRLHIGLGTLSRCYSQSRR